MDWLDKHWKKQREYEAQVKLMPDPDSHLSPKEKLLKDALGDWNVSDKQSEDMTKLLIAGWKSMRPDNGLTFSQLEKLVGKYLDQ